MSTSLFELLADPPGVKSADSCTSSNVRMRTSHAALSKSANAATHVGWQLLQQQYLIYVQ